MEKKNKLVDPDEVITLNTLSANMITNIQKELIEKGLCEVYLKDIFGIRRKRIGAPKVYQLEYTMIIIKYLADLFQWTYQIFDNTVIFQLKKV